MRPKGAVPYGEVVYRYWSRKAFVLAVRDGLANYAKWIFVPSSPHCLLCISPRAALRILNSREGGIVIWFSCFFFFFFVIRREGISNCWGEFRERSSR